MTHLHDQTRNKNEMMQDSRRQALDLAADCLSCLDNKSDSVTVIKTRFAPSQAASLCHMCASCSHHLCRQTRLAVLGALTGLVTSGPCERVDGANDLCHRGRRSNRPTGILRRSLGTACSSVAGSCSQGWNYGEGKGDVCSDIVSGASSESEQICCCK